MTENAQPIAADPADRRRVALVVYRPLVEKIIAALGALVTHQLAYLVTSLLGLGPATPSDHGHLPLQWAIVAPLAVAAGAGFVVWQLKALGFRVAVSIRVLSALIAVLFLAQEAIEGLVGGLPAAEIAANPALLAGLAVAPPVAWLLKRVLTGATALAARLLSTRRFVTPGAAPPTDTAVVRFSSLLTGSNSRPRAPPSLLRI